MASLADMHLLAVDDEEVMLKMYRDYFAQKGVKLRTAASAADVSAPATPAPAPSR